MSEPLTMRLAGVVHESVTDGPGIRTTIFFQGCPHACAGCHNPHTWRSSSGQVFTLDALLAELRLSPLLSGVTFSGGEPFAQAPAAAQLARAVKLRRLDLWVYTGYVWEQLVADLARPGYAELLRLADVVVDGPYQQALRDPTLPYRGSRNQRIILPGRSLEQGRVVEWASRQLAQAI